VLEVYDVAIVPPGYGGHRRRIVRSSGEAVQEQEAGGVEI
jgi:hypothetical protein